MPLQNLILHIGTHKTGTTSIQRWCYESREALAAEGYLYPAAVANPSNPGHHYLAHLWHLPEPGANKRWDEFRAAVEGSEAHTVIASSELFSVQPASRFEWLTTFFASVTVVCAVRRHDQFVESMFKELVKSSFWDRSADEFVDSVLKRRDMTIFSNFGGITLVGKVPLYYDELFADWAAVDGVDSLAPIALGATRGSDALSLFKQSIGIDRIVGSDLPATANASYHNSIIRAKQVLDPHLTTDQKVALRPVMNRVNRQLPPRSSGSLLGSKDRRSIAAACSESLDAVSRRWPELEVDVWRSRVAGASSTAPAVPQEPADPEVVDVIKVMLAEALATPAQGKTGPSRADVRLASPSPSMGRGSFSHVGLNIANAAPLARQPKALDHYLKMVDECGLNAIRLPLYWRRLVTYNNGVPALRAAEVNECRRLIAAMSCHLSNVTGLVVSCPAHVLRRSFEDPAYFADQYRWFVQAILSELEFLTDLELWNEPNGSDFYLSVRDSNAGQRPWSGREYVDLVVVPGLDAVEAAQFEGQVCGVTFAENGIVGHRDREVPPFMNMASVVGKYFDVEREENRRNGSFYFVPDFAAEVLEALDDSFGGDLPFDSFAIHPYPYFRPGVSGFAEHSLHLVDRFIELTEAHGFAETDIWVTEVGARSLDFGNRHRHDQVAQAEYVRVVVSSLAAIDRVKRLYWYKDQDRHWDLIQEKAFGLLDHTGAVKPAYLAFRNAIRKATQESVATVVADNFDWGAVMHRHALDPEIWKEDKSTRWGYSAPGKGAIDPPEVGGVAIGQASVVVFPGRNRGDWWSMTTKRSIVPNGLEPLEAALELADIHGALRPEARMGGFKVRLDLLGQADEIVAVAELLVSASDAALSVRGEVGASQSAAVGLQVSSGIDRLTLQVGHSGLIRAQVVQAGVAHQATVDVGPVQLPPVRSRVTVVRESEAPSLIQFTHFRMGPVLNRSTKSEVGLWPDKTPSRGHDRGNPTQLLQRQQAEGVVVGDGGD